MTQANGMTTLTFTRYLSDPSNPINTPTGSTYINWAYGNGNTFAYHNQKGVRLPFVRILKACTAAPSDFNWNKVHAHRHTFNILIICVHA